MEFQIPPFSLSHSLMSDHASGYFRSVPRDEGCHHEKHVNHDTLVDSVFDVLILLDAHISCFDGLYQQHDKANKV